MIVAKQSMGGDNMAEQYYDEVRKYTGDMSQIAGIKSYELLDGKTRGTRAVDIWTGSGLQCTVVLDRCMDVSMASYKGKSLCWRSPAREVHPYLYEPEGMGWVHGFFGGLVTTCGLTYLGAPCVDQGEPLSLHGKISYIPAEDIGVKQEWVGSEYTMSVSGSMRQVSMFGENLLLRRTITTWLGKSEILLEDEVTNEGYEQSPFMFLYHINIGFPLLSPSSQFISTSEKIAPRDDEAADGIERFDKYGEPVPGYHEKVYYHAMKADRDGRVKCAIIPEGSTQDTYGLGIVYNKSELPEFVQWKMEGERYYVLGVEPSNCWTEGRDKEREWGTLQTIKAKEKKNFSVRYTVLKDEDEVHEFTSSIQKEVGGNRPQVISKDKMIESRK
jgi:hypothetical protein